MRATEPSPPFMPWSPSHPLPVPMMIRRAPFAAVLLLALASCGDGPTPPVVAQCLVSTAQVSSNPASTGESPPAGSPAHLLVDDFAGPAVNTRKWQYYDMQGRTTQDDRLAVSVAPDAEGYGGLMYRLPQRLTGSSFMAEVGQPAGGGANVETVVGIATPDEEEFVLLTSFGGNLQAVYNWKDRGCNDPSHVRTAFGIEYCMLGSVAFDASAHRFRRLREQDGTIHLELSPDGQAWSEPAGWRLTHHFIDAGALHGLVAAGTPTPYSGTSGAYFENVNTSVPAIPRAIGASCPSNRDVIVTWERSSVNETGFGIERRTGAGAFALIGTVGGGVLEFRDPNAPGATTYEYRVRAINGAGGSGYSRTVTVAR